MRTGLLVANPDPKPVDPGRPVAISRQLGRRGQANPSAPAKNEIDFLSIFFSFI